MYISKKNVGKHAWAGRFAIAQASLFSDQAHFRRTFKQLFGLTPKQLSNMAASEG